MPAKQIVKQLIWRIPIALLCNKLTEWSWQILLTHRGGRPCREALNRFIASCAQYRSRNGDASSVNRLHAFFCKLNQHDTLMRSCQQALVRNPYDFASCLYLGFSLHMLCRDNEARECYRRFAAINTENTQPNATQPPERPRNIARLQLLGQALLRGELWKEAAHDETLRWLHQLNGREREQLANELRGHAALHMPGNVQSEPTAAETLPATAPKRKKLLIWGFDVEVGPFLDELTKHGDYEIVEWFSRSRRRSLYLKTPEIIYQGASRAISDKVCQHQQLFIEASSRTNQFLTKDLWHYLNNFHIYMEFFAQKLISTSADCVVFANLPHVGYDLILYYVAKALGITTVCLYQASTEFVAGVYDIEDFGYFAHVPQIGAVTSEIALDKNYRKSVPYMQTNRHTLKYSLSRALSDYKTCGVAALLRHTRHKAYERNVKAAAVRFSECELKRQKYVYFPLHLQPELTTTTLGRAYRDQVTALEHLSQFIPSTWLILAKENPKQGELMRPKAFFDRLAAIPNLRLVAPDVDTYELTHYSEFVATITGTAGWEAVSGGKNALIFGQPWYLTLPGVFSFQTVSSLQEILNYRIDHAELTREYARLRSKMCPGLIVDALYVGYLERFDPEANGRRLGSLIRKLVDFADGRIVADFRDTAKPGIAA